MITVKAKRDLISAGEKNFTKGHSYTGTKANVLENVIVTNDQGLGHRLGNWSKYFEEVK